MPPPRKQLAAALLLFALTMAPELAWAGAHLPRHHHGLGSVPIGDGPAALASLAEILVHGHHHEQGVPVHRHDLLAFSPVRPEAPRSLGASCSAFAGTPAPVPPSVSPIGGSLPPHGPAGVGPPLLYSLCTLLI